MYIKCTRGDSIHISERFALNMRPNKGDALARVLRPREDPFHLWDDTCAYTSGLTQCRE